MTKESKINLAAMWTNATYRRWCDNPVWLFQTRGQRFEVTDSDMVRLGTILEIDNDDYEGFLDWLAPFESAQACLAAAVEYLGAEEVDGPDGPAWRFSDPSEGVFEATKYEMECLGALLDEHADYPERARDAWEVECDAICRIGDCPETTDDFETSLYKSFADLDVELDAANGVRA